MRSRTLVFFLVIGSPAFGALRSLTQFDAGPGGNDSYPCGYDHSSSGTDQSLSTTPWISFGQAGGTNANVTATVLGTTITITRGTYTPTTADEGNTILFSAVTGGTLASTTVPVEILSTNGSTTFTVDRDVLTSGSVTGTNLVGYMGGRCASPAGLWAGHPGTVNVNLYLQYSAIPYSYSTAITSPASCIPVDQMSGFWGYYQTHGDNPAPKSGHQPALQASAAVDWMDISTDCGATFGYFHLNGNSVGVCGINASTVSFTGCVTGASSGIPISTVGIEVENMEAAAITQGGHTGDQLALDLYLHNHCLNGTTTNYTLSDRDWGIIVAWSVIANNGCIGAYNDAQVDQSEYHCLVAYGNTNHNLQGNGTLTITSDTVSYGSGANDLYWLQNPTMLAPTAVYLLQCFFLWS